MKNINELLVIFSNRLIELMEDNHLSIKDMSIQTNIPRSTINSWTLKKRSPRIDYLNILADYFNVTTDYLLGREN